MNYYDRFIFSITGSLGVLRIFVRNVFLMGWGGGGTQGRSVRISKHMVMWIRLIFLTGAHMVLGELARAIPPNRGHTLKHHESQRQGPVLLFFGLFENAKENLEDIEDFSPRAHP